MQGNHTPSIDARYWAAITLASVFGTNLGDLYAHESGFGLLRGLPLLILLFALVCIAERFDRRAHEAYFWAAIIILRTGATNIADYLTWRLHVDGGLLSVGLGVALAALAYYALRRNDGARALAVAPKTDALYWTAMLTAGVFGTALGDYFENLVGKGPAAIGLSLALALALLIYKHSRVSPIARYWLVVGVARTTGTAIGDWLAESSRLNIGLELSTLLTGLAFVGVVVFWRRRRAVVAAAV